MGINQSDTRFERLAAAAAHPLAELLQCPQEAGSLLGGKTERVEFEAGQVVFRQQEPCKGLYVVIAGDFVRKADRFDMRLTLGAARPGDLLELAAVLGDRHHKYSLSSVGSGTMLLMPIDALHRAFESYPPLRMKLLEELAREVSRAYITCCLTRVMPTRRNHAPAANA
jgi:CRP-like cAMP-binding protein